MREKQARGGEEERERARESEKREGVGEKRLSLSFVRSCMREHDRVENWKERGKMEE